MFVVGLLGLIGLMLMVAIFFPKAVEDGDEFMATLFGVLAVVFAVATVIGFIGSGVELAEKGYDAKIDSMALVIDSLSNTKEVVVVDVVEYAMIMDTVGVKIDTSALIDTTYVPITRVRNTSSDKSEQSSK
jgi:hypothetical protein